MEGIAVSFPARFMLFFAHGNVWQFKGEVRFISMTLENPACFYNVSALRSVTWKP